MEVLLRKVQILKIVQGTMCNTARDNCHLDIGFELRLKNFLNPYL